MEKMEGTTKMRREETFAPAVEMEGATVVVAPGQPPSTDRLGDLYKIEKHLGKGGFGTVFSAKRLSDGKPVAIKYLSVKNIFEWGQGPKGEVIPMEAYLLHKLNYVKGVVKLLEVYAGPGYFALILDQPASPIMDLFEYMNVVKTLSEGAARKVVRQLVRIAMDVMDAGVFHRDIKDENLLYQNDSGDIFLIDFGSGEEWKSGDYYTFSGTHMCKPREFLVEGCYKAEPATVWSIGVLTYRLIVGVFPYNCDEDILNNSLNYLSFNDHLKETKRAIRKKQAPPSSDFTDFVSKCLQSKPFERARLAELAVHNWLYEDPPHIARQKNQERALALARNSIRRYPTLNNKITSDNETKSDTVPLVEMNESIQALPQVEEKEGKVDSADTSELPCLIINEKPLKTEEKSVQDALEHSPNILFFQSLLEGKDQPLVGENEESLVNEKVNSSTIKVLPPLIINEEPIIGDHSEGALKRSPRILIVQECAIVKNHDGVAGSLRRWYDSSVFASEKSKPIFYLGDKEVPRKEKRVSSSCLPCTTTSRSSSNGDEVVYGKLVSGIDSVNVSIDYKQLKSAPRTVDKCSVVEERSAFRLAGIVSRVAQAVVRFRQRVMGKRDPRIPIIVNGKALDGSRPWIKTYEQLHREQHPHLYLHEHLWQCPHELIRPDQPPKKYKKNKGLNMHSPACKAFR